MLSKDIQKEVKVPGLSPGSLAQIYVLNHSGLQFLRVHTHTQRQGSGRRSKITVTGDVTLIRGFISFG